MVFLGQRTVWLECITYVIQNFIYSIAVIPFVLIETMDLSSELFLHAVLLFTSIKSSLIILIFISWFSLLSLLVPSNAFDMFLFQAVLLAQSCFDLYTGYKVPPKFAQNWF